MAVSPETVLAVVLAAAAVLGLVSSPAAQVRKTSVVRRGQALARTRAWIRGRPDGLPIGQRVLVALAAGPAFALALNSLTGIPDTVGWALAGPIGLAVGVFLGRVEPGRVRYRNQRLVVDTPAALELLAACLAAGLPPRNATAAVVEVFDGPVAEDLGRVLAAIDVGVSDAVAWRTLSGHPQLGAAAVDLARCVDSGTMMVETLTHHARDARRQRHAALEVAAKAVGVRSVLPLMTCFIPAFLLLGIVPTLVSAISRALPAL
jgi:pilus assembly protein TadC